MEAIATLKVLPLFADIKKYGTTYDKISKTFSLFSLPFSPAQIGYASARLAFDLTRSDELLPALDSPQLNPYLSYFKEKSHAYLDSDIIGLSIIYTSQLLPALTIASQVKTQKPDTIVLLGGPCASSLATPLQNKFGHIIDLVVPGDGESFLKYIAEHDSDIKTQSDFLAAASLYLKTSCQGPFVPPSARIDFSWTALEQYLLPEPVLPLDITRGCYYGKCVFCAYGHRGAPYRRMDLKDIVRVLNELYDTLGVKRFFFSVDVIDPAFLKKVSEAIVSSGLEITYCLDARLEQGFQDKNFARELYRSGCRAISFGMESACQKTLEAMKKGTRADHFSSILRNLCHAGIHVQLHLIHGFPGEKASELKHTIKFLQEHRQEITTAGMSPFTLLRDSSIEKRATDYGLLNITRPGDLALDYKYELEFGQRYPSFEAVKAALFEIFPTAGRLTGSTTDYLIYASLYSPRRMKEMLSQYWKEEERS